MLELFATMSSSELMMLSMALPLFATLGCFAFRDMPNLRDTVTFAFAVATCVTVVAIYQRFEAGEAFAFTAFTFQPGIAIAFEIEPLGMVFALVATSLWIVTHIYGVGYMRGNGETKQARFFACFAIAIFATLGIAYSANLATLFLFYELLTISTYPLVAHKETREARMGARTYLGILMVTSIVFLLTAIIWTYVVAGRLDFVRGGILGPDLGTLLPVLLALFAFGIGKAALMPFHRWLPAAMVAPTPVSALLHAVAVVKAGVFSILKVGVYIFGIDTLADTGASVWLMWLAAFSILAASIVALQQDNLKRRLAYSTVSQLSYITLGMALATSMGVLGGGLHIVTHAVGKITLFMCAGAIYVATHKTEISDMRGLGRAMPVTFIAFGVASLSIIGLPPLVGSWSKWLLLLGAADTGQWVMIVVLMISSLLNVAYLLPVFARGFFTPEAENHYGGTLRQNFAEAPLLCVVPLVITATSCFVLFFLSDGIMAFLEPVAMSGSTVAPPDAMPVTGGGT